MGVKGSAEVVDIRSKKRGKERERERREKEKGKERGGEGGGKKRGRERRERESACVVNTKVALAEIA